MELINEGIKEKVKYFYEKKILVHIVKKNSFFHNGLIISP